MFGKGHQNVPMERLNVLRAVPMFAQYSDHELREIDGLVCQLVVAPGRRLMKQGDAGREAFIVLAGDADVVVDGEVVATVHAGDVIGEMSLIDNKPRSASVVATTPLEVLAVDPRQFAMLFTDPRTARWIAMAIVRRLRDAEQSDAMHAAI